MVHDCSSHPGNSGSPIFAAISRGGRPTIIVLAMHSTATVARRILPFRGEDGNVATRMADILPSIRPFCRPPQRRRVRVSELFVETIARLC